MLKRGMECGGIIQIVYGNPSTFKNPLFPLLEKVEQNQLTFRNPLLKKVEQNQFRKSFKN
jgi:hypothetical protein